MGLFHIIDVNDWRRQETRRLSGEEELHVENDDRTRLNKYQNLVEKVSLHQDFSFWE